MSTSLTIPHCRPLSFQFLNEHSFGGYEMHSDALMVWRLFISHAGFFRGSSAGWVFFSLLFYLHEGEHRVYGADGRWDTKRLGLPLGQKYDRSWLCEWLIDVLRASNRDKNEFPFHVASSTTKRCLWDLLGFTTFLDISNQFRDIRSRPLVLSNTLLPCSHVWHSFFSDCLLDPLTFFFETRNRRSFVYQAVILRPRTDDQQAHTNMAMLRPEFGARVRLLIYSSSMTLQLVESHSLTCAHGTLQHAASPSQSFDHLPDSARGHAIFIDQHHMRRVTAAECNISVIRDPQQILVRQQQPTFALR